MLGTAVGLPNESTMPDVIVDANDDDETTEEYRGRILSENDEDNSVRVLWYYRAADISVDWTPNE